MKFLFKEFTEAPHWMHLDIAGVGGIVDTTESPYLAKGIVNIFCSPNKWEGNASIKMFLFQLGMTGRPTRTLVEALTRISQNKELQKLF